MYCILLQLKYIAILRHTFIQVWYPLCRTHNSKIQSIPKSATFLRIDMTPQVESSTPDFLWWTTQNYLNYCIKLPSGYVHKVYMKHKWTLCFDFGSISKITNWGMQVFQNMKKKSIKMLLVPNTSDKECQPVYTFFTPPFLQVQTDIFMALLLPSHNLVKYSGLRSLNGFPDWEGL